MIKGRVKALIKSAGKRKKLTAAAVTVIVLAAAAAAAAGGGKKNAMPAGMMGQQTMNNVATVKAVAPQTGSIEKTTSLAGKVEPADVVYVYAKAGGDVTSVLVKAGDTVQAGQLLCTIDTEQVDSAKTPWMRRRFPCRRPKAH